jgi:hypothetical protein
MSRCTPLAETLKKNAEALGVTPDFLNYGTSGEKPKAKLKMVISFSSARLSRLWTKRIRT